MKLHREGRSIIIGLAIGIAIILYVLSGYIPQPYFGIVSFALAVLFILVVQFFRVPNRVKTKRDDAIVAPADGKVVVIEDTFEKEYLQKECLLISIFMSPLNVHQNTFPISGDVIYTKHHKGKFMAAWHAKASELNERHTVVIDHHGTPILMRQIAGAMARRISCHTQAGEVAEQSEEMGFIKFGSRVDVYLPVDSKPTVQIGDKVRNSVSVLATLPEA